MSDTDLKNAAKTAVGHSLASSPGEACMRTRCQDVIPRMLSGACREAGRGKEARKSCMPLLKDCQNDAEAHEQCVTRCARYFEEKDMPRCVRDCDKARCRVYKPYDECVARRTLMDLLTCMEGGEGRKEAESCLKDRCGLTTLERTLSTDYA